MAAMTDELICHGRDFSWTIDEKTKVSTIINSLPKSCKFVEDLYTLAESEWTVNNVINKIDHQEYKRNLRNLKDQMPQPVM